MIQLFGDHSNYSNYSKIIMYLVRKKATIPALPEAPRKSTPRNFFLGTRGDEKKGIIVARMERPSDKWDHECQPRIDKPWFIN
jgi:hypothetical protein